MGKSDSVRRERVFRGRVQGVGFRYSTTKIAEHYSVTGYVQNLPNGSVLLVVEGDQAEVESFLDDHASKMDPFIESIEETLVEVATGNFSSFGVRLS